MEYALAIQDIMEFDAKFQQVLESFVDQPVA